jgi:hypothetical protein
MKKEILKDAQGKPIAVKIAYQDWLKIDQVMTARQILEEAPVINMARFRGTLPKGENPDAFQERMREEWT